MRFFICFIIFSFKRPWATRLAKFAADRGKTKVCFANRFACNLRQKIFFLFRSLKHKGFNKSICRAFCALGIWTLVNYVSRCKCFRSVTQHCIRSLMLLQTLWAYKITCRGVKQKVKLAGRNGPAKKNYFTPITGHERFRMSSHFI